MNEAVRTNTKKTFLSGVLMLTLSTLLVKVVGLFYKIPMLSYLGSEGMGYFNSAYELYTLFCIVATAGLPTAMSVLIASAVAQGDRARVIRVWRTSLVLFAVIGFVGWGVLFFGAEAFCRVIKSRETVYCIRAIAPTVFFVCLSSAVRGYFQGYQKMLPTALSQVLEAVGKLIFGLLFASYGLKMGKPIPVVAGYAGWGLTVGTLLSLLYLLAVKFGYAPHRGESLEEEKTESEGVLRALARMAIPMTLGASMVSLTKLVDMTMILRRLQDVGYSEAGANEAYGSYTTLALSVYGLLPTLVNAVALPLLPMLSAAIASGERRTEEQMIRVSFRLTVLFALPASLGLSAFARPVLSLIFPSQSAAVAIAAPLLSALGVSVFLSCMITATNSVLHAYRAVKFPILSMLVGAAVKSAVSYVLIGRPEISLLGAPVSTFLCNAAVVLLNLVFASRITRLPSMTEVLVRPLAASSLAVGGGYLFYLLYIGQRGESTLASLFGIGLCMILYVLLGALLGVFREEELSYLPMGKKLVGAIRRRRRS